MRRALALLVAPLVVLLVPTLAAAQPGAAPGPAYLVYAGPYASSPSSAFGHLFLVLAEDERDPAPLWTVHTFNAITFDVDPVRYLTVGITGGFLGRFDRFPFHQKTREYEVLDDRDLWLVELRLSPAQRAALEAALAAHARRWYPYSFFHHNCAFYLQELLAEATGAVPPPGTIATPTGTFTAVLEGPLAGGVFHRPSATRRIAGLASHAAPAVVARLRAEDWRSVAADRAFVDGLGGPDRALALDLFSLRQLQATEALPDDTRAGLARLRLRTATAPASEDLPPEPAQGAGEPVPPPAFHPYPRVGLAGAALPGGKGRVHLSARGAMQDETDPWDGQQPASTLELLSVALSSPADRASPRLEAAVLFSQRALRPSDWTQARASWLLEAGARRGGVLADDLVHLALRTGVGKTVALPGETYLHGLVTFAVEGAFGRRGGAAPAPGLEAGVVTRASGRWRLGASFTSERDLLRLSRHDDRLRAWTRVDAGRRCGAILSAGAAAGEQDVRLGVDCYL